MLAALVALVAALATTSKAATQAERGRMEIQRARLMAEAGIQRAVAELQEQDPGRAYNGDAWASLGDFGSTQFSVGRDSFRMQILDASARVDLNTAELDQLKHLPLTQQQIDSVLDWRDTTKGAAPRAEGAKDEYYNRLSNPYNAKLAPFDDVDELLLVRGFTPGTLYTTDRREQSVPLAGGSAAMPPLAEMLAIGPESADLNASGKAKLDINAATAADLTGIGIPRELIGPILQAKGSGFKKMEDVLKIQNMTRMAAQALADNVTIGKDTSHRGLINVNTAPEAVLASVPGMKDDVAAAIAGRQGTGFKTLGELLDVPGVDIPMLASVIDRLCVGSKTFLVRVIGVAGTARVAGEATLVMQDGGQVLVARWQPLPYWSVLGRWNWQEETRGRTVLGATS